MDEELKTKKIIFLNLKIYLAYTFIGLIAVGMNAGSDKQGSTSGFLFYSTFCKGIHLFVNLISGVSYFSNGDQESGKAYLFSMFMILVIGFPLCSIILYG